MLLLCARNRVPLYNLVVSVYDGLYVCKTLVELVHLTDSRESYAV